MNELLEALRSLDLPAGDYVVFGSGPLLARGIIEASDDLDVLCRGDAWDAVCDLAASQPDRKWGIELVSLLDGRLTFGRSWAVGEVDVDEIIDTAEILDGLPFARLVYVIAYKRLLGRAKDIAHLEALARHEALDG